MGDRTGDSFRGWVYALGLCGGWGALGVYCGLRFSTYSLAGWGVGLLGCSGEGSGGGCRGVFRFGKKHFGAAYHLCDECHIFNIFGVTVRSE